MKLKRLIALTLSLIFITSAFTAVSASSFPNSYWQPHGQYLRALEAKDYENVIIYGNRLIEILNNHPPNNDTVNALLSHNAEVAKANEGLRRYTEALPSLRGWAKHAAALNSLEEVFIAEVKIHQFTPQFNLYQKTAAPQMTRPLAKHEHGIGVKYGTVSESAMRPEMPGESVVLIYLEFGDYMATPDGQFSWILNELDKARSRGLMVELALNFPKYAQDAVTIANGGGDAYIRSVADMLASYSDIPVFLRFGAEMNNWDWSAVSPQQFVGAFRRAADIFRARASNVAMVWSVVPGIWMVDMNDFYPGDAYVDWVGVSLYATKYSGDRMDRDATFNQVNFAADGFNPVLAMQRVIDLYGARKPIMLSESGAMHRFKSPPIDESAWGKVQLEKMLKYIPMVFPQVKMMLYFDVQINHELNDYQLSHNSNSARALRADYLRLVRDGAFVQANNTANVHTFAKVADSFTVPRGRVEFNAFAHFYGTDKPLAVYRINGNEVFRTSEVGYPATLDFGAYNAGAALTLTVELEGITVREYRVTVEGTGFETPVGTMFTDINDHWGRAHIEKSAVQGLLSGKGDGTFDPEGVTTRAQFVQFMYNVLRTDPRFNFTPNNNNPFPDVDPEIWYAQAVAVFHQLGLFAGVDMSGGFKPDEIITRLEMSFIIAGISIFLSIRPIHNHKATDIFSDVTPGAAALAIETAVNVGILTADGMGNGKFGIEERMTRAQMAALQQNLLGAINR
jgi:hypothetical protein